MIRGREAIAEKTDKAFTSLLALQEPEQFLPPSFVELLRAEERLESNGKQQQVSWFRQCSPEGKGV